jgi:hypothetical protein
VAFSSSDEARRPRGARRGDRHRGGIAAAPAHASVVSNALTVNALASTGSTIEDLNGVAVEAVTLPDETDAGLVDDWAGY